VVPGARRSLELKMAAADAKKTLLSICFNAAPGRVFYRA
jgi:hypothetical protein